MVRASLWDHVSWDIMIDIMFSVLSAGHSLIHTHIYTHTHTQKPWGRHTWKWKARWNTGLDISSIFSKNSKFSRVISCHRSSPVLIFLQKSLVSHDWCRIFQSHSCEVLRLCGARPAEEWEVSSNLTWLQPHCQTECSKCNIYAWLSQ